MIRPSEIVAWLVVDHAGQRSAHVDQARAVQYAADHRGVCLPMVVVEAVLWGSAQAPTADGGRGQECAESSV